MSKILLVEDDNNLREIYEARLQAEGYEIVSAKDGEETLVVAKNEKPDLVISDVMMPKISGFEMLDILRNTDGLKDIKTIMLTALGQAEDKSRADALGADKYLVKSQVTLEDIVKTAHELLQDSAVPTAPEPTTTADASAAAAPDPAPSTASAPTSQAAPTSVPVVSEPPVAAAPVIPVSEPPAEPSAAPAQNQTQAPAPVATPAEPPMPTATGNAPVSGAQSTVQEEATVSAQIEDFINSTPASTPGVPVNAEAMPEPAATPAALTTELPAPTDTASNDATMQDAVDTLVANTEQAERPSEVKAVDVSSPADNASTPAPEPAAPTPSSDNPDASDLSNDGNAPVAHKKVIQPLSISDNPKPDLDTLLAKEEAKEQIVKAASSVESSPSQPTTAGDPEDQPSQGQPGTTPAPQPNTGSDFDPNNIAL